MFIIEAKVYESSEKYQGFGAQIESGIKAGIDYFQDQLKVLYFQSEREGEPVYRSKIAFQKVKPKLVELVTYIKRKPVMEGVCPLLPVTLVTGKVLDNGDIHWMIPITNGPIDDNEIFIAEELLAIKINELESNSETRMSDELMYLRGFYEPHFYFTGVVRKALSKLNQSLLVLDIDKSGNYEIKATVDNDRLNYLMFELKKDIDNLSVEQLQKIIIELNVALSCHEPNGRYGDSVTTDFLADSLSVAKKRLAKLTNTL